MKEFIGKRVCVSFKHSGHIITTVHNKVERTQRVDSMYAILNSIKKRLACFTVEGSALSPVIMNRQEKILPYYHAINDIASIVVLPQKEKE